MANPISIFDGNDTFIGGPVANTFHGYGGDDTFDGGTSLNSLILNDTLFGGDGNDTKTIDRVNVGPTAFLLMSRYRRTVQHRAAVVRLYRH